MDRKVESIQAVARNKRKRIPVISLFVDLLYGTVPAPFFVIGGQVAPAIMMRKIPGTLLVCVSCLLFYGTVRLGQELGGIRFAFAALIPLFVHWLLFFAHALPYQSEKLFDLAGQIGFCLMNLYSFLTAKEDGLQPRQVVVTILVFVWSLRLGYFLFTRFLERKKDFRFVEGRSKNGYHFFAWISQGVW